MRQFATAFLAVFITLAPKPCLTAQEAGPEHAPDFRALPHIAPLYFPPKPHAPFMALAKTLWVHTLPDGSTVTQQNARVVARDVEGRIFQERRTFVPVPSDGKQESRAYATEYTDPVAHTLYRCNADMKVCNLFPYYEPITEALVPAGLQPDGTTYLTRENLGMDTFSGLDVQRSRETITLYAQTAGNSRTILRTSEYWYSPALGVNAQVKRHDPRDGDQTLWLTDISLTAAEPETFKVPAGYRVIDHRDAGAAARQPEADR
jgi:hypothetical protein